ncbi:MAG: hypothetical protein Q8K78_17815 [Planctomycetaceae bacterium]|nr:hypothetical protein [Planctomycetaceae bacterium]
MGQNINLWQKLISFSVFDRTIANYRNPRRRKGFEVERQLSDKDWDRMQSESSEASPDSNSPFVGPPGQSKVHPSDDDDLGVLLKLIYPVLKPQRTVAWLRWQFLEETPRDEWVHELPADVSAIPHVAVPLRRLKEKQANRYIFFCSSIHERDAIRIRYGVSPERIILLKDTAIRKRFSRLNASSTMPVQTRD